MSPRTNNKEPYECPVCTAKYHSVYRRYAVCKSCKYRCCSQCVQRYLLTCADVHCMNCRAAWTLQDLSKLVPMEFIHHRLYSHHVKLLHEHEMTLMPATAVHVRQQQQLRVARELRKTQLNITGLVSKLQRASRLHDGARSNLQKLPSMYPSLDECRNVALTADLRDAMIEDIVRDWDVFSAADQRELYTIVMDRLNVMIIDAVDQLPDGLKADTSTANFKAIPCTDAKCTGVIIVIDGVDKYCCKVCKKAQCAVCRVVLDKGVDQEHQCDPQLVETLKMISDSTRPCPKCKEPIEKNAGCDQMFCTSCHTGFDWRTMQIIKGRIHNPHYFDWLSRQQQQEQQRRPVSTAAETNVDATSEFQFEDHNYRLITGFFRHFACCFRYKWTTIKNFVVFANMCSSLSNFWSLVTDFEATLEQVVLNPDQLYHNFRVMVLEGKMSSDKFLKTLYHWKKRNDLGTAMRSLYQRVVREATKVFTSVQQFALLNRRDVLSLGQFIDPSMYETTYEFVSKVFDKLMKLAIEFNTDARILSDLYNVQITSYIELPSENMLQYGMQLVRLNQSTHASDAVFTLNVLQPQPLPLTSLGRVFVYNRDVETVKSHYNQSDDKAALQNKTLFLKALAARDSDDDEDDDDVLAARLEQLSVC